MKGYLDRIENGELAVILLEEEGFEMVLPFSELPEGSQVGSWFRIYEEDGRYSFLLDEDERIFKEQMAEQLTRKLKMKSRGSKYKRK